MTERIKLDKADYFELRTLIRDCEAVELEAMKAMQVFTQRQQEAKQKCNLKFEALAKEHGFDISATYNWDDKTFELIKQKAEA